MLLYDMEGNKIVERNTGLTIVKDIKGRRAKEALRRLNDEEAGFQGFTPEFFLKPAKIGFR